MSDVSITPSNLQKVTVLPQLGMVSLTAPGIQPLQKVVVSPNAPVVPVIGYVTSSGASGPFAIADITGLQGALDAKARLTGGNTFTGTQAFGVITVTDDAYAVGWDGSLEAPTKNAVYDKITTVETAIAAKIASTEKGAINGVATLDSGGKVPSAQLPSYVDDVLEYANLAAFPATGSSGVLYVDAATNYAYRWSGSAYVQIAGSGTGPSTTDGLAEGATNLYFTTARVLGTAATGLVDTAGTPAAVDTVLTILGKIKKALFTDLPTSLGLKADLAGATFTGKVTVPNPAVSGAGINVGYGTTPTTLASGDLWVTSSGLFFRGNSSSFQMVTTGGATFTGKVNTVASATGGAGLKIPHGAAPTAPVDGDVWSTMTGFFGRLNGATVTFATLSDITKAMAFFCSGIPTASETIGGGVAPYALTLTQANCVVRALTAATASTTIVIKKNGTQVGTAVFAAAGTVATVTFTDLTIALNDYITLHAPTTPDATLADIMGTLR